MSVPPIDTHLGVDFPDKNGPRLFHKTPDIGFGGSIPGKVVY